MPHPIVSLNGAVAIDVGAGHQPAPPPEAKKKGPTASAPPPPGLSVRTSRDDAESPRPRVGASIAGTVAALDTEFKEASQPKTSTQHRPGKLDATLMSNMNQSLGEMLKRPPPEQTTTRNLDVSLGANTQQHAGFAANAQQHIGFDAGFGYGAELDFDAQMHAHNAHENMHVHVQAGGGPPGPGPKKMPDGPTVSAIDTIQEGQAQITEIQQMQNEMNAQMTEQQVISQMQAAILMTISKIAETIAGIAKKGLEAVSKLLT